MPECSGVCPQETLGLVEYESPYVANDEWICRKIRPLDFGASGNIKSSFVQTDQLKNGSLSVWRLGDPSSLGELAEKLGIVGSDTNLLATLAVRVRTAPVLDRSRPFSVVNDTRTDDIGGHDTSHAAIAPCQLILANGGDIEVLMPVLKTAIAAAFRLGSVSLLPLPPEKQVGKGGRIINIAASDKV